MWYAIAQSKVFFVARRNCKLLILLFQVLVAPNISRGPKCYLENMVQPDIYYGKPNIKCFIRQKIVLILGRIMISVMVSEVH